MSKPVACQQVGRFLGLSRATQLNLCSEKCCVLLCAGRPSVRVLDTAMRQHVCLFKSVQLMPVLPVFQEFFQKAQLTPVLAILLHFKTSVATGQWCVFRLLGSAARGTVKIVPGFSASGVTAPLFLFQYSAV